MTRQVDRSSMLPTSGRMLARNTVWNFVGQVAPLLVALIAIPVIVAALGTERFGILSFAWMTLGSFTLFDLGLGRALTKLVAERLGHDQQEELPALIWTALMLMVLLGVVAGGICALLSPLLVERVFNVPSSIRTETLQTFYLLAGMVPVVISTTGMRGILEARQRFDLINAIRIPLGAFTFLGPLLALPFTRHLFWVTLVLVAGRLAAWAAHLWICLRLLPSLKGRVRPGAAMVKPLLQFGGWMTVSNLVSPLLVHLDRILIAALVSVSAVAYYSTSWEVVTKLLVLPGAVVGVLFPAFTYSFVRDPDRSAHLYRRALKYVFLVLFPITLTIVTFAREGLEFWLGSAFAENGFRSAQLLVIGVLMNGLASIPFALVQGAGRPDVTARFHVVEAMLYVPCAWWLISAHGIVGAAAAWTLRAGADALLLLAFSDRYLSCGLRMRWERQALGAALAACALAAGMLSLPLVGKFVVFGSTLLGFALLSWIALIGSDERLFISSKLGTLFRSGAAR